MYESKATRTSKEMDAKSKGVERRGREDQNAEARSHMGRGKLRGQRENGSFPLDRYSRVNPSPALEKEPRGGDMYEGAFDTPIERSVQNRKKRT